jgi:hypothetical protein
MVWTDPRTWTTGELVTAAMLNTHLRDNLKAIGDPQGTFTPTLTNITIGNGTVSGYYLAAGKLIIGRIKVLAGSTTTYSAGNLGFSLPVAASANYSTLDVIGNGAIDNGAGASRRLFVVAPATTTLANLLYEGGTVTNTAPTTWGTSARITFEFCYEAA